MRIVVDIERAPRQHASIRQSASVWVGNRMVSRTAGGRGRTVHSSGNSDTDTAASHHLFPGVPRENRVVRDSGHDRGHVRE